MSGEFLRMFDSPAHVDGGRGPKDLKIDTSGRLFVVEADVVSVLNGTGEVLQRLVIPESERLSGIALSTTRAFVTECEKGRVHVLELCS